MMTLFEAYFLTFIAFATVGMLGLALWAFFSSNPK